MSEHAVQDAAGSEPGSPIATGRVWVPAWLQSVFVYLFYLFLSIGCFYPALTGPDTALLGKPGSDALRNVWGYWWFKAMLLERFRVPAFTTYLNYPRGMLILLIDPLNCLLSLPLQLTFELPVAYNYFLVAVVAFNGFSAYLLALELTERPGAALVAGTLFGFAPFVLSSTIAGNSEVVNGAWIPLFFLFLHRTLEGARWRDGLLTGIVLMATTLSSWYYGYIVCLIGSLYAVGYFGLRAVRRQPFWPVFRALSPGVLFFVLSCILMIIVFWDILPSVDKANAQGQVDPMTMLAGNGVNLYDMYQPNPDRWDRPSLYHFPPLLLALLPFALVLGIRRAWPFAILGAVSLLLAISYHIQTYPIELAPSFLKAFETLGKLGASAYDLFRLLPFSGLLRFPSRFMIAVNLAIALILSAGLRSLMLERQYLKPVWVGLGALLSFFLCRELLSVSRFSEILTTIDTRPPDYVEIIARDPDPVGVVNLPTNLRGEFQLFYQTYHRKPMVNYVDFVTSRIYFVNGDQIPLSLSDGLYSMHLRGFDKATDGFPKNPPEWPTPEKLYEEMQQWKRFGLRYVVVERGLFAEQSLVEFEGLFAPHLEPLLRSQEVDLYRLK